MAVWKSGGVTMRAMRVGWSVVVMVVLWAGSPARAWQSSVIEFSFTPIGGAVSLPVNAGVHRELKATGGQVDKLKELSKSMGVRIREEAEKLGDLPDQERPAKARKAAQALLAELRKK